MEDKRAFRIILVGAGVIATVILWTVTFRYNLQGGFRKKINTAKPVEASGQLDQIEAKIKTLKENFKISQEQIDQLIQKEK